MTDTLSFTTTQWNDYAHCYDALTNLRPYADMITEVAALVPKSAQSVLDLGCGTGTLLSRLSTSHKAQLTGIDNSPQMLALANKKLGTNGATLHQGDLENAVEWGGPYDCVTTTNVLYTMNDPLSFLKNIKRVITTGGTIILVTPKIGYDNGLILKAHCQDTRDDSFWCDLHRSLERERRLIHEALGDSPLAKDMQLVADHNRRIAGTRTFHFFSEPELRTLVHNAGLQLVDIRMTYAGQNFLTVITQE